jgi:uncharacterized protein
MFDPPDPEVPVEIPYTRLDPDTLRRVAEDLVTRDGTDYGEVEKTLAQKVDALLAQLERGEAKLVMDMTTETIGLMTSDEFARRTHAANEERVVEDE